LRQEICKKEAVVGSLEHSVEMRSNMLKTEVERIRHLKAQIAELQREA